MPKKRRRAITVVEEQEEPTSSSAHRQPLPQRQPRAAASAPPAAGAAAAAAAAAGAGAGGALAAAAQRQAAEFLTAVQSELRCTLGSNRRSSCDAFRGPLFAPCTHCGCAATQHELLIDPDEEIYAEPQRLLGRTAWLLLRSRGSLSQLRSFSWAGAFLGAAQTTAPEALGLDTDLPPPVAPELTRSLALYGNGCALDTGSEAMEAVVRLLCDVDQLWFKLYYYTATEAPALLASCMGATGVPGYGEWVQRAVGATLSSAWLGGQAVGVRMVEAQAVACGKGRGFEAGRKGLVMDVEGTEAAAMLRRGCVAAVVGASAFALPAAQIGDPAAPVATDANEPFRNSKRRKGGNAVGHLPEFLKQKSEGLMTEGNELLKVYECVLVETQLLFKHTPQLQARQAVQWARLATDSEPEATEYAATKRGGQSEDSSCCCVCAKQPKTGKKKKKKKAAPALEQCSFCGGCACQDDCSTECVRCEAKVCLRCRYQDDVCPRCDFPTCPPALALYRDAARDPACHLMAYAIPSNEALNALADLKMPLVECGAGTGYWASLLREHGVEITAYDIAPNDTAEVLLERFLADQGEHEETDAQMMADAVRATMAGQGADGSIVGDGSMDGGGGSMESAGSEEDDSSDEEEVAKLFDCDYKCGFRGSYADVEAHELSCGPHKQRATMDGPIGSIGNDDDEEDDEGARLFASMQAGVDIYSAGLQMGMSDAGNEYHAAIPAFTEVLQGGTEAAAEAGSDAALFLCYPPPDSPMAMECMKSFKGNVLCYVGEWQGDTATPKFEKALRKGWSLRRRLGLPNWAATANCLMIWERNGSHALRDKPTLKQQPEGEQSGVSPMPCACCGEPAERRCRFCHAVAYCSADCAAAHAPSHQRSHGLRGVELPSVAGEVEWGAETHYATLGNFTQQSAPGGAS